MRMTFLSKNRSSLTIVINELKASLYDNSSVAGLPDSKTYLLMHTVRYTAHAACNNKSVSLIHNYSY